MSDKEITVIVEKVQEITVEVSKAVTLPVIEVQVPGPQGPKGDPGKDAVIFSASYEEIDSMFKD